MSFDNLSYSGSLITKALMLVACQFVFSCSHGLYISYRHLRDNPFDQAIITETSSSKYPSVAKKELIKLFPIGSVQTTVVQYIESIGGQCALPHENYQRTDCTYINELPVYDGTRLAGGVTISWSIGIYGKFAIEKIEMLTNFASLR